MIKPYEDGKLILKTLLIAFFVLIIVGYGLFQSQKIIKGPTITLSSPHSGDVVHQSDIDIKGVATNISSISLNDRPIFIDEQGAFMEKLMLYPGYNIIKLRAEDKFGSSVEKDLEIVYQQ
jgi:Glucodextranase, domain B